MRKIFYTMILCMVQLQYSVHAITRLEKGNIAVVIYRNDKRENCAYDTYQTCANVFLNNPPMNGYRKHDVLIKNHMDYNDMIVFCEELLGKNFKIISQYIAFIEHYLPENMHAAAVNAIV